MKLAIAAALLSSASAFMAGAPTKAMPKGAVALQAAAAPTVNGEFPGLTMWEGGATEVVLALSLGDLSGELLARSVPSA